MLRFSKIVGTGNDFIFIDLTKNTLASMSKLTRVQLAVSICRRNLGVGADGIIYVEKDKDSETLSWDFFNRDGSQADFCGNAARCFGRWAQHYLNIVDLSFESRIGKIRVLKERKKNGENFLVQLYKLEATLIEVNLKASEDPKKREIFSKLEAAYLVNSGVPHFVCVAKKSLSFDDKMKLVAIFRFHPDADLSGANVSFLYKDRTESFERGVENFTLSCGTGVLAAAICIWKDRGTVEILLQSPGGPLSVEIVESRGETVTKANLIGPAELICEGSYAVASNDESEDL